MDNKVRDEFWHSLEKSPFIMIRLTDANGHAEPMTAQLDRDAHHAIWFFTSCDNRIAPGGRAMAQFSSKGHDVFACLSGSLSEETDKAIFDKHWSKEVEAWFPGGRDDSKVLMLRYDIDSAEVWTAELGIVGAFKLLTGSAIRTDEMGKHEVGLV